PQHFRVSSLYRAGPPGVAPTPGCAYPERCPGRSTTSRPRGLTGSKPMSQGVARELSRVLAKIDRPGSFCVSRNAPAVRPGVEVEGVGPIGFPRTAKQAKELKGRSEQAPYGKGEETIVDTSVRKVWRLKPEHFALTNPEWETFLRQTVRKVQEELGLERQ